MKNTAERGDTVTVHYKGTLPDGSVFDASEPDQPLQFTIGAHEVIDGFETAVIGMSTGDRKTQAISAEDAYGEREDELIFHVPRASMAPGFDVSPGDFVRVTLPDGQTAPMQVLEIDDEAVTLDANHPLAGKTLTFELELVEIR